MSYGDFKELPQRPASDKVLRDKAFNNAKSLLYIKVVLLRCFFNKKPAVSGAVKSQNMSNQQLAEELQKTRIRKFEKCKVYSSFKDNIWAANLADMHLISKFNIGML